MINSKTREIVCHIGVDVPAYRVQRFFVDNSLHGEALIEQLKRLVVEGEEFGREYPSELIEWDCREGLRIVAADDEFGEVVAEGVDIETNHVEIAKALIEAKHGGDVDSTRLRLLRVLEYAGYSGAFAKEVLGSY